MDSRGTHGSLMARDSIREQKPLCNCDRNWTGYSTGEVRTFLEWDPVPGGCRVANTGYALTGLRPAGKAIGGPEREMVARTRATISLSGPRLPPQKRLPCGSAAPVFTGPGRRRRPGPGRSTAGGRSVHSPGQTAAVRQSPARKRGRYSAASR